MARIVAAIPSGSPRRFSPDQCALRAREDRHLTRRFHKSGSGAAATEARLDYLDSIRGVAAFAVVSYHCWLAAGARERLGVMGAPWSLAALPLRAIASLFEMGRAAVMLFFVLSGFVLARSLLHSNASYAGYAIKRLLRIYPAFLIAVVLSYLVHRAIGVPHPDASVLMMRVNNPGLSALDLLQTLALWGTSESVNLDLVTWSLVHELRISLLLPLILWSIQWARGWSVAAYAALSLACTLWLWHATGKVAYGFVEDSFSQTVVVSGYFVVFFAAGAWLAIERQRVAQTVQTVPLSFKFVLAMLCGLIFLKADRGAEAAATPIVDYAHGAAALGIIALVSGTPRFIAALGRLHLRWLGRVSYSLYLLHLPVLYVVMQTFGAGRTVLTTCAVIVLSLGGAEVMARSVELPFIDIGKRLSRRLTAAGDRSA